MRSVLYMAAVSASQHNPLISSFYNRLVAKGKAPKIALTACMRKLLVVLGRSQTGADRPTSRCAVQIWRGRSCDLSGNF